VARGHEVVGLTGTVSKQDLVRSLGAGPVVVDALVPDAVAEAVASAGPGVVVHQLTVLSGRMRIREMRHPERSFAATMTIRLRSEATDHLVAAGGAVGARRFVAQSVAAPRFARVGGPVPSGADRLAPSVPVAFRPGLAAILQLEEAVTRIEWGEGLVLRYGGFSGPGTGISLAPEARLAGRSAGAGCRWSGVVVASGRSCTSRTPRRRPSPRSSTVSRVSTASLTTSRRRCGSGCRCWRARWVPSPRGVCHAGWCGWRPVRWRPR
jgi:hypothetical protein